MPMCSASRCWSQRESLRAWARESWLCLLRACTRRSKKRRRVSVCHCEPYCQTRKPRKSTINFIHFTEIFTLRWAGVAQSLSRWGACFLSCAELQPRRDATFDALTICEPSRRAVSFTVLQPLFLFINWDDDWLS